MRILIAVLITITAFSVPLIAQDNPDEPISVITEEVKLNVAAYDLNGKFVDGVKKNDLVVIEDGRLHQPDSIRRVPATVLIVMDTGGTMRLAKDISLTRKAAQGVIDSLSEDDEIALMDYSDKPNIVSEWTKDRRLLTNSLNRKLSFGKRSAFVEALNLATKMLKESRSDNRHLILISEGTDTFADDSDREAAMKELLTTNINVHVLSYTGLEGARANKRKKLVGKPRGTALPSEVQATMPEAVQEMNRASTTGIAINTDRAMAKVAAERANEIENGEEFLKNVAENTNGLIIIPRSANEMVSKARWISDLIDSNYVVTYTPRRPLSESPDGEERVVEVSAKRNGIRVSARRVLVVRNKLVDQN